MTTATIRSKDRITILKGMFGKATPPVSIDAMNAAIAARRAQAR